MNLVRGGLFKCHRNEYVETAKEMFQKGPGPRPKTFSRRDRDQTFFSPGPKMTGPAHV